MTTSIKKKLVSPSDQVTSFDSNLSSSSRNTSSTDAGFRQKRRSTCQQHERFFDAISCLLDPVGFTLMLLLLGIFCCLHLSKLQRTTWRIIWASKSSWARLVWCKGAYSHLIFVQIVQSTTPIWGKSLNSAKCCALCIQKLIITLFPKNGFKQKIKKKHCLDIRWEEVTWEGGSETPDDCRMPWSKVKIVKFHIEIL